MSSGLFIRAIRLPKYETALSEPDVRFEAHYGLNSDIARGPKSADFVAEIGMRTARDGWCIF
jgi:hypothetical protein